MKTMNLNAAGVLELSAEEMGQVDGGWVKEVLTTVYEIYKNWDECVAAFNKGLQDGSK